ncbi:MAG: ParB/RepB/Spo0J family partition protein [Planctomycetaceae bacterium]
MALGQKTKIPVSRIVSEKQVREEFNEEGIAGLAATMGRNGQLNPVIVRKSGDKFILVDGERRWRAAKQNGMTELDATVVDRDLSPAEILELSLTANIQREDLTPPEKAFGIKALMEATGENCSEVALRLGMTNSMVSRLMPLTLLSKDIIGMVARGEIPASAAPDLAKIEDEAELRDAAEKLRSGALTRDGLTKLVRRKKRPKPRGEKPALERLTAMLGLGRIVNVFAPTLSLESLIELLEELLAKARKAKTQNLSIATFARFLEDQCRA